MRNQYTALLTLAALVALSASNVCYAKPKAESQKAKSEAAIADALEDIASTYREQAKRAQADKNTEPCKAGDDRRYSDLCAQWKAADAASDAASWGKWGFIAGSLSLLGVIAALFISIWSNLIVRGTAKHELRAYLGVSGIVLKIAEGDQIIVKLIIHNYGSTPAHKILSKISARIDEFSEDCSSNTIQDCDKQICPESLHPGADFYLFQYAKITDVSAMFDNEDAFYVYGTIEYDDFDRKRHTTDFSYRGTGVSLMNKREMYITPSGNTAT